MKRGVRVTLFVVLTLIAVGAILLALPALELNRRENVNARMHALGKRLHANPRDSEAISSLLERMKSGNSFDRTAAVIAVREAGGAGEPAVDLLIQMLPGPDWYNAREAALTLGDVGPAARRAVPARSDAVVKFPQRDVGWFAAESLGRIADTDDARVTALLTAASASDDERMRYSAGKGLRFLSERRALTTRGVERDGRE